MTLTPNLSIFLIVAFGCFFGTLAAMRVSDRLMLRDIEVIASECEEDDE